MKQFVTLLIFILCSSIQMNAYTKARLSTNW